MSDAASTNGNGDGQKKETFPLPSEATPRGLKVSIGEDEWIEFEKKDWGVPDYDDWMSLTPIPSLGLLVSWLCDWHVKDRNGAWIPFDKAALMKAPGRINITWAKTRRFSLAVQTAFREAQNVPLA